MLSCKSEENLNDFLLKVSKEIESYRCDDRLAKLIEVVCHPVDGVNTAAAVDGAVEDAEDLGVEHLGGDCPRHHVGLALPLRAGEGCLCC